MNKVRIPKTYKEACEILDSMLSEEDKAEILSKTKNGFTCDEHFGLGLWIRNNWIYGQPRGIWFPNPDIASSDILECYYDHLHGNDYEPEPLPFLEEI